MANRFLNNIRINDAYTFPASDGNDGQVITTDGAGNLAFENVSPDAASVIYRDNFTGDGNTASFDLQNPITDEDQTQIYIDGVYQEKGTYSVSGSTITFTTAPLNGHSVEVISISSINTGPTVLYQDNFTGNGNDTAFTLGQIIDNEIKTFIFLNGVYQFKNTYTLDGTTLTFDTAPANGVSIEVISIASATQSDSLEAGAVIIPVKNTHTASISKGTPVYITGNVGASERLQIAPADASNSAKMPAAGLLLTTLAVNAEGYAITGGYLRNITTDTIDGTSTTSNDTVYVKAGGGLTMTKPTGSNLIQNIAKVARSASGSSGSLIVSSILRTNDIPNLTTGKIWVGDSNTVESTVIHLDESNNRLGINNNSPSYSLDVTGDANISSNLIVGGNLTVQGTETILNTQTVEVEDNILQLNTTQGSPDTATATTSGISVYRGNGVTQASFIFDDADDTWDLTNNLVVTSSASDIAFFKSSQATTTNVYITNTNATANNTANLYFAPANNIAGSYIKSTAIEDFSTTANRTSDLRFGVRKDGTFNEAVIIDSSGNVTIGTGIIKPSIGGDIAITQGSIGLRINDAASAISPTTATVNNDNAVDLGVSNIRFRNLYMGGNMSAGRYLNLTDSDYTYIQGTHTGAADGEYCMRVFGYGDSTFYGSLDVLRHDTDDGEIRFRTRIAGTATDVMTIVDGNVGIGTTSPNTILEISQNQNPSLRLNNEDTSVVAGDTFGTIEWYTNDPSSSGTGIAATIKAIAASDFTGGNRSTDITFSTASGTVAPTERMRIDSSGIVTVSNSGSAVLKLQAGTNSSASLRLINDAHDWDVNCQTNDKFAIYSHTDATERLVILPTSGNVGIGTTSPSNKLDVNGSIRAFSSAYVQLEADQTDSAAVRMGVSSQTLEGFVMCNNEGAGHISGNTSLKMLVYSTGGALIESARFTVGGVGIGTTNPAAKLQIDNASGNTLALRKGTGTPAIAFGGTNADEAVALLEGIAGGGFKFYTGAGTLASPTWTERMRIDSFGQTKFYNNVSVIKSDSETNASAGTDCRLFIDNPSNTNGCIGVIDFKNYSTFVTARIGAQFQDADDKNTDLYFMTRANGGTLDERMRINSSGNVGIGTTSPGHKLDVYRDRIALTGLSAGTGGHYIALSGQLPGYAANLYNCLETNLNDLHFAAGGVYTGYISYNGGFTDVSDISLKENIEDIPDALNKVNNLRGRYFTWKNELQSNDKQIGFIAQEVEEYIPEVVTSGAGGTKGIAYGKITALLVNAIKELKAEVETLKTQINN